MSSERPGRVFQIATKPSPETRKLVFDPPRGEGKGAARDIHTTSRLNNKQSPPTRPSLDVESRNFKKRKRGERHWSEDSRFGLL